MSSTCLLSSSGRARFERTGWPFDGRLGIRYVNAVLCVHLCLHGLYSMQCVPQSAKSSRTAVRERSVAAGLALTGGLPRGAHFYFSPQIQCDAVGQDSEYGRVSPCWRWLAYARYCSDWAGSELSSLSFSALYPSDVIVQL